MNKTNRGDARVSLPLRNQWEFKDFCLDEFVPQDHLVRVVWAYVDSLDLSRLYKQIVVSSSQAGRSAIAPEILVTLWLFATLESINSAREIARRCKRDLPFMWICGGVSVNHHAISDFRKDHPEFLESLLIDSVATLIQQDLVSLKRIAQDGMRVRAHAGRSSFRRKPTLEELRREAQDHLKRLENEEDRQELDRRKAAAHKRAIRERAERIEKAVEERARLAEQREKRKQGDGETTRCSTTDPEARRMKMANGGYDPAFNVQLATDADNTIIVGVDVTNEGTDARQLPPMVEWLEQNYGRLPDEALVDSAFATQEAVSEVESKGVTVIGGISRASQIIANGNDPYAPKKTDKQAYKLFRQRMGQTEYQEIYKRRSAIAEFPNAVFRNHGLRQFRLRGLAKVKTEALWHAIAFNFRRMLTLGVLGGATSH